jgi:hypothetical protein
MSERKERKSGDNGAREIDSAEDPAVQKEAAISSGVKITSNELPARIDPAGGGAVYGARDIDGGESLHGPGC